MRIRFLAFFVCLLNLAAADYRLIYTGRLYGYFRYPEIQSQDLDACPVAETKKLPFGKINEELLKQFGADNDMTTVRLSTGDNFAPFILSRQISAGHYLKSKEDFDPPVDNVACLMQLLHLDAVVPGRHDFYYGPERLRHLARILRQPRGTLHRDGKDPIEYKPVRMLAANITLRSRAVDPKQPYQNIDRAPDSRQPAGLNVPVVALPQVVTPWLRTVRVNNALRLTINNQKDALPVDVARTRLRSAAFTSKEANDFNDQLTAGKMSIGPLHDIDGVTYTFTRTFLKICIINLQAEDYNCDHPEVSLKPRPVTTTQAYHLAVDIEYSMEKGNVLAPNTSYYLVLTLPGTPDKNNLRQGFRMQAAYFESPLTEEDRKEPGASDVKPWVCVAAAGAGQEKVAVFGVVDPSLGQFIGRLNDTWLNTNGDAIDRRHETNLVVSDPAESLQQVLDYYRQLDDCKGARKVLLAQMPQQKISDLIARLQVPFDVVIAQADADLASGQKNLNEKFDSRLDDRALVQPLVVVPGVHFYAENPYGVTVRSQQLVVSNHLSTVLTGTVKETSPSVLELELGPADHHIALDAPGVDLTKLKDRQVAVEGIPSISGSVLQGRIDSIAVSKISEGRADVANGVVLEQSYRNVIKKAETEIALNPLEILRDRDLAARDKAPNQWLAGLPKAEQDAVGKTPPEGAPEDVWKGYLENVALSVMQAECHSDVAFLQHRDLFVSRELNDSVDARGLYALVNTVFWKGDFIQCMNLPGATINALMTQSRDLQQQENRGIVTDLSRGWGLASMGAGTQSSQQQNRLLDGHWLDPKKLYSVATTDFLANGDTGYPALRGIEPAPYVPLGRLRLPPLSGCVAVRLLAAKKNLTEEEQAYMREWCAESTNTLDRLQTRSSPPPAKKTGFKEWAQGWRPSDPVGKIGSPLERTAQWRPLWSLELFRADASYNLFLHDGTEGYVTAKFPGITVVDLTAPQSVAINLDYFVRAQRDTGTWQFYAVSELNYGHRIQRGKPSGSTGLGETPYQVSLSANFWYHEAGWATRFLPAHRNPSGWKLQLPVGLRTQFAPQLLQIVPPSGTTSNVVQPKTVRNFYVSGRPGLRYEYAFPRPSARPEGPVLRDTLDSFVEFGFQGGEIFHEPSEFHFTNGTCYADGLGACLSRSPIASPGDVLNFVVSKRNLFQEGAYVNFRLDLPMPFYLGSELVVENRGDFFINRRHDTEIDPKFMDDLKASLTLPLYRKIALAPTFELIVFQNKIGNVLYRSYASYIALNYSFDWRTGLSWKKVLGFANPVPALPTMPAR